MRGHDHLLAVACIAPLLVTARLPRQTETVPLQNCDHLIRS